MTQDKITDTMEKAGAAIINKLTDVSPNYLARRVYEEMHAARKDARQ